jgi:hypothetical protein
MSVTRVLPEENRMDEANRPKMEIRRLQGICEAEICARMMPRSDEGV